MMLRTCIFAIALFAGALPTSAHAQNVPYPQQQKNGGSWTYFSPGKPGCLGISVSVQRNGSALTGTAWFGTGGPRSQIAGTIDTYNRFSFAISPMEQGAPQGKIDGAMQRGWIQARITGSGCNDGPINIEVGEP